MVKNKEFKIVVIGDGGVGKTCLLIRYVEGKFPEIYIPPAYENGCADITDGRDVYKATMADTAGGEDYYRLRPLVYPGSDVLILCFALNDRDSYESLKTVWEAELQRFRPHTPVVLVGTKSDLEAAITTDEAKIAQGNLKAVVYLTCSSKLGKGVNEVFDEAFNAYKNDLKLKKSKCLIL